MAARKSRGRMATMDEESFTVAVNAYEAAMKELHGRDWKRAGELLSAFVNRFADKHDLSEMVDRARLHLASCDAKLAPAAEEPDTADGWMLIAVAASNDGDVDGAVAALDRAAAMGAPAGRTEYVRAAALASADRIDEALASLGKAIAADPENRAFSLGDPDFERLRETAGYVALVEPPESGKSMLDEVMRHGQDTGEAGLGSI